MRFRDRPLQRANQILRSLFHRVFSSQMLNHCDQRVDQDDLGHRRRNLSFSQERTDVSRKRDAFDFVCLRRLSAPFTPPANEKLGFQARPIRQPSWWRIGGKKLPL